MIVPIFIPTHSGGGDISEHQLGVVLIVAAATIIYFVFFGWLSLKRGNDLIMLAAVLAPLIIGGIYLI